jgi:FdhD protein
MISPRRSTARLPVVRWKDGGRAERDDVVTVEEPLEIRVTHRDVDGNRVTHPVAVTMRTPGDDFELAAGFLFGEGLIRGRRDIHEISYCSGEEPQEYNLLEVRLAPDTRLDTSLLDRNFFMTSSCGVCGKASIDAVEVRGCTPRSDDRVRIEPAVLTGIPGALREAQPVFDRTGGIHAAALFEPSGTLLDLREDVGRHNAVDKLVGSRMLAGELPLTGRILAVSGRASFELVQKAVMAGLPVMVAVGAPSSLAIEMARRFDLTLVGFTKALSFNVYAGAERIA